MSKEAMETIRERIHNRQGFPVDYIGKGSCGGKAKGLIEIQKVIEENPELSAISGLRVSIPSMIVIRTGIFADFMELNGLWEEALNSHDNNYIAHLFQKASLPPVILGDLRSLITAAHEPLAVRSSSLLEDSADEPFAGVYATKMLPNNQQSVEVRFSKLVEAIKYVYSSLFFSESKEYFRIIGKNPDQERMAVIIQSVIGNRYKDRFYPVISGVGRSYNHYPMREARREDGVVNLALGLGKTIVDGGWSWVYCPAFPQAPPPYNGIKEIMQCSQNHFWAVKMGKIPEFNPVSEVEFLENPDLEQGEKDGVLKEVSSTYDHENDMLRPGIQNIGPRLINFAPVLKYNTIPLNDALKKLLKICREFYNCEVEIEFALRKQEKGYELGFLQVREMAVHQAFSGIADWNNKTDEILIGSDQVLGDGERNDIYDIVLVKRDNYDPRFNQKIAEEIAELNKRLVKSGKTYLLIGYGRWGSSDPWLGIPVKWSQISGARVIVEATLPEMNPDLSQGSHFFHNLIAFNVFYLSVKEDKKKSIDWQWLQDQEIKEDKKFVIHLELKSPLQVIVSSSGSQGVIFK